MINFPGAMYALPSADPIIELEPVKNPIRPKVGDFIKSKNRSDDANYKICKVINIDRAFITYRVLFVTESNVRYKVGWIDALDIDMFQRIFIHATKQDLEGIEDIKEPEPGSVEVYEIKRLILKHSTFIEINGEHVFSKHAQIKDLLLEGIIWINKKRGYRCKITKIKNGLVYYTVKSPNYNSELTINGFLDFFEPLFMPGDTLTYNFPSELKFNSKMLKITRIIHKQPDDIMIKAQQDGEDFYNYDQDKLLELAVNYNLIHKKAKFEEKVQKYHVDHYQEPKIGEIWCGSDVCYENMLEIIDIDKENEMASVKLAGPVKYKYLPDQIFDIHFNSLNCYWNSIC